MTVFQCWRNSILVNRYDIVCWYFHQHTETFLPTQFTNIHLYNIIFMSLQTYFFQEGFNYLTCKISKILSFSWIFRKIQSSSASYIMNSPRTTALAGLFLNTQLFDPDWRNFDRIKDSFAVTQNVVKRSCKDLL